MNSCDKVSLNSVLLLKIFLPNTTSVEIIFTKDIYERPNSLLRFQWNTLASFFVDPLNWDLEIGTNRLYMHIYFLCLMLLIYQKGSILSIIYQERIQSFKNLVMKLD